MKNVRAGKERGKSESNAEVRCKHDENGEKHQRHGNARRAMLRQVKGVRAGKERRKSERRAEQDSGKAKRSSSR